ncbi:MAG: NAD(P)H-hydrate dehydratase [Acidimicrobiia bacterium]|nr:NAD(P)H-hydrate dehydratase [Acidimicrobiia bacterium]
MKPVITPEESARLDAASIEPVTTLMERAGLAVALAAVREGARYGKRVIALAGPGSNGGDAYVAARYLRERGVAAEVRSLGYPRGEHSPARIAGAAAVAAGVPVRPLGEPEACDLVIDGLFGAGFHGSLPDLAAAWTACDAPVIAIDVPSGLRAIDGSVDGAVFDAARTVTFHALKVGHLIGRGPDLCGVIEIADIGLSGERPVMRVCEDDDAPVPIRERRAHKWSAGSVLVVGGSAGLTGAPALAARSALEFGAGAVRIACPGALQSIHATMDPGVMTTAIGDGDDLGADAGPILAAAERFDVIAVGPGMGTGPGSAELIAGIAAGWDRPLVIDADAINAMDFEVLAARTAPTVITPHHGEFQRLTGEEPGWEAAAAVSAKTGAVVLLKGGPTFVTGNEVWAVTSGGPELATIGTGDVLTGMIAALIAAGLDPETAARSAAHRHGLAAAALNRQATVTATGLMAVIGEWA